MPCGYINFEKWYELRDKEKAEKAKITNVLDFYKIMKKEYDLKENQDNK